MANEGAFSSSRLLAYLFFAGSAVQLFWLVSTWVAVPISEGGRAIFSSPWSVTALVDYTIGAVFASLYIWLRNGPKFLGISPPIWALLTPFLGGFALFAYVSHLFFVHGSIASALFPVSASGQRRGAGGGGVGGDGVESGRSGPRIIGVVFVGFLGVFVAICGWAIAVQPFGEGVTRIMTDSWAYLTLMDNLAGLLFIAVLVVAREARLLLRVAWVVALAALGNGATCVYVILLSRQAWKRDVDFASLLLSERDTFV